MASLERLQRHAARQRRHSASSLPAVYGAAQKMGLSAGQHSRHGSPHPLHDLLIRPARPTRGCVSPEQPALNTEATGIRRRRLVVYRDAIERIADEVVFGKAVGPETTPKEQSHP